MVLNYEALCDLNENVFNVCVQSRWLSPGFFFISFSSESQSELVYLQEVWPVILLPHETSSPPSQWPPALLVATWQTTWKQEQKSTNTDISYSSRSHAVPALARASLRADARAAGPPDALLHRGHSGQKHVRVRPGRPDADSTVSELVLHQSDSVLPDPDLRAHADPPGSVPARARGHVRVHLPVPALRGRLYTRADPSRPAGWDLNPFCHVFIVRILYWADPRTVLWLAEPLRSIWKLL